MNQNQFDEVVLAITDECKQLLLDKGKDYSSKEDKLQNFKQAAMFTSCDKWQALEIYFFKHIQAISNWFKNGRPQLNEDIHHRIRDSINYLILLEAMIVEEEQSHESSGDAAKVGVQEVVEAYNAGFTGGYVGQGIPKIPDGPGVKHATVHKVVACKTKEEYDLLNERQDWRDAFKNQGYTHFGWLGASGQEIWPLD